VTTVAFSGVETEEGGGTEVRVLEADDTTLCCCALGEKGLVISKRVSAKRVSFRENKTCQRYKKNHCSVASLVL
jgi:hypothetical protein